MAGSFSANQQTPATPTEQGLYMYPSRAGVDLATAEYAHHLSVPEQGTHSWGFFAGQADPRPSAPHLEHGGTRERTLPAPARYKTEGYTYPIPGVPMPMPMPCPPPKAAPASYHAGELKDKTKAALQEMVGELTASGVGKALCQKVYSTIHGNKYKPDK